MCFWFRILRMGLAKIFSKQFNPHKGDVDMFVKNTNNTTK